MKPRHYLWHDYDCDYDRDYDYDCDYDHDCDYDYDYVYGAKKLPRSRSLAATFSKRDWLFVLTFFCQYN